MQTRIKTEQELYAMRESGKMLATVLDLLVSKIAIGMTEKDLNNLAETELAKLGGNPAFKGYGGFPASLCVSVNDAVVHGIPSDNELRSGDVVSMDFGVVYKDMITDAARTVALGESAPEVHNLITATLRALDDGINAAKGGCHVGDIAAAVQAVLDQAKLGIVRDLVGHGVGHELHEDPNIPNFGTAGKGPVLKSGMTIAIEPMATMGSWRVYQDRDGWTIRTYDGSKAAHFEDTILLTDDGSEILTRV